MTDREITLEQICTEPDLSKELKEKGFPQNTLFYWNYPEVFGDDAEDDALVENPDYFDEANLSMSKNEDSISAPTVNELAEAIGEDVLWFKPMGRTLSNGYYIVVDSIEETQVYGATIQEVLANLWLWLKTEKLTQPKER